MRSASRCYAYWNNIITIITIIGYFPFYALFFVGISAMIMPSRRPDIYNGSPADWRPGGIPMLQVCGLLTSALAALSTLLFYFQDETGLASHPWWAAISPGPASCCSGSSGGTPPRRSERTRESISSCSTGRFRRTDQFVGIFKRTRTPESSQREGSSLPVMSTARICASASSSTQASSTASST